MYRAELKLADQSAGPATPAAAERRYTDRDERSNKIRPHSIGAFLYWTVQFLLQKYILSFRALMHLTLARDLGDSLLPSMCVIRLAGSVV
jgi:hypothetical protein